MLAMVRLLWPHSNLGPNPTAVLGLWHSFLEHISATDVERTVRQLAADGREHAPPIGVVVKAAVDRSDTLPEWDEVRSEILRAVRTYRPPPGELADPYAGPPASFWSHPAVARFMEHSWTEWRMASEDDGTFNAQQRDAYNAMKGRLSRERRNIAVGADTTAVDEGNVHQLPTPFKRIG